MIHPHKRSRIRGFSLLELSIVLLLIALVAAMGISASQTVLESSKAVSTNNRVATIETALAAYRQANNRLPCPADGSVVLSAATNAAYGYESGAPGACTGWSAIANVAGITGAVVEGVVPVRTLNLPDEFMFDGWGRKIGYAVTSSMTGTNAFIDFGNTANCGLLSINGAAGTRTNAAVYALISYGPNGHGGFDANARHTNAHSANTAEKANCHCDGNGADTGGFSATYIQQDATRNPANYLDSFDDIVRYKERWQMHTYADEANPGGNLTCPQSPKGVHETGLIYGDDTGSSVATGDVNGDGIADLIIGAPVTGAPGTGAGKVYVVFGQLGGYASMPLLSALDGTNGFVVNGVTVNDQFGASVAAGDINGDGMADVIVGAPKANAGKGAVFVIYGKASGWAAAYTLGAPYGPGAVRMDGTVAGELAGSSVAAGDVNDDGMADIIIGAPGGDKVNVIMPGAVTASPGKAYVVYGSTSLTAAGAYALNAAGLMDGAGNFGFPVTSTVYDGAGTAVAAGDVNGDGIADILIGAPEGGGGGAGTVYTLYGHKSKWATPFSLAALDGTNGFSLTGAAGDRAGMAIAVGDINGDRVNDIIVGAPHNGNGSVYTVFGKTARWERNNSLATLANAGSITGFRLDGIAPAGSPDSLGMAVAAGDINGDGKDDLVLGAPVNGGGVNGHVYIIFGAGSGWPVSGAASVTAYADGTAGVDLPGVIIDDHTGYSVAAGDFNGDGRTDAVIGAWGVAKGAAYVFYGQRKSGSGAWASPYSLSGL